MSRPWASVPRMNFASALSIQTGGISESMMSMVVVSLLWRFIYDGQNGLLNSLLAFLTAHLGGRK